MQPVYVRPLRMSDEADKAQFVAAVEGASREFPTDVFTLPSTRVMVAEQAGRVVMYQPHFTSLVLGSLIPLDAPTEGILAAAQSKLLSAAYTRAHTEGLADILAFSPVPATRAFALRHGFTERLDGLQFDIRSRKEAR